MGKSIKPLPRGDDPTVSMFKLFCPPGTPMSIISVVGRFVQVGARLELGLSKA